MSRRFSQDAAPWLAGLLLVTGSTAAAGADMWLVSNHYSAERFVPHIHYSGPVLEGDAQSLADLLDQATDCDAPALPADGGSCAVVTLNSPGGNYIEGLKLARLLRERAVTTVVEAGLSCYSACAFAFLGGSGYSSQDGVGAYGDRIVEPGGVLGFHAPYFAPDDLGTLVADFGMDTVLGASRDDIALMVEQLVDWNVDPNILGYIVSMGPDESYDVTTGEDYYLTRSHLPPSPLGHWIEDSQGDIRNACLRLLAYHANSFMDPEPTAIGTTFLDSFALNEAGQALSGYRIGPDNPLGVTYCGLPSDQQGLSGDVDLSLYTAPGVSGAARPLLSLFHRPDGWSSLGTGSQAVRRPFKKGGYNAMFTAPFQNVSLQVSNDAADYLAFQKFVPISAYANGTLPRPESSLPLSPISATGAANIFEHDGHRIMVHVGNTLLLERGMADLPERDVAFDLTSATAEGYVYGGTRPSGRPFVWFSLQSAEEGLVALVEVEAIAVPDDHSAAVEQQYSIACSFTFLGSGLTCQ